VSFRPRTATKAVPVVTVENLWTYTLREAAAGSSASYDVGSRTRYEIHHVRFTPSRVRAPGLGSATDDEVSTAVGRLFKSLTWARGNHPSCMRDTVKKRLKAASDTDVGSVASTGPTDCTPRLWANSRIQNVTLDVRTHVAHPTGKASVQPNTLRP
jgi:hypothetical protein